MDAATKMNTSMGATAFRALTNRSPTMPTHEAEVGDSSASTTPATRPIKICTTRLPLLTNCNRGFCLTVARDRKRVVQGKSVYVRVDFGGCRSIKKKKKKKSNK